LPNARPAASDAPGAPSSEPTESLLRAVARLEMPHIVNETAVAELAGVPAEVGRHGRQRSSTPGIVYRLDRGSCSRHAALRAVYCRDAYPRTLSRRAKLTWWDWVRWV